MKHASRQPVRTASALLWALVAAGAACAAPDSAPDGAVPADRRVVLLVVDGLRPDYVTPELMPRLDAFAARGVRGLAHHAVYPTVTRVNAASIFTGTYPETHGILGNVVYVPAADPGVLNTQSVEALEAVRAASGGALVTTAPLADRLEALGRTFLAIGSGSAGSTYLMNPNAAGAGVVHPEYARPAALTDRVARVLGPGPEQDPDVPFLPLVAWAVDAALTLGVDDVDADVIAVWLTEPDHSAHALGIGGPATDSVLAGVDREIGRLLDGLAERGELERTDVLVTSDHGFSTRTGRSNLTRLLVDAGLKASPTSTDVVVAGDAIHVNADPLERIPRIVSLLQETEWVGPIFSLGGEAGGHIGGVPGTFAFGTIRWGHARRGQIVATAAWNDDPNAHGYEGTVALPGVAGHGSLSLRDVRATFLAAGPGIRTGVTSAVPSANVDLAPTVLALLGEPAGEGFDGRPLGEILRGGPDPWSFQPEYTDLETATLDGRYRAVARVSSVAGRRYVDWVRAERR